MAKKILMIVGDYVEDYEVMVPFQALQAVSHGARGDHQGREQGGVVVAGLHRQPGRRHRVLEIEPGVAVLRRERLLMLTAVRDNVAPAFRSRSSSLRNFFSPPRLVWAIRL